MVENRISRECGEWSDLRIEPSKRPQVLDRMTIALSGVNCGADQWVEIVTRSEANKGWLRHFVELAHGIAWHDTFGDGLGGLDAAAFGRCLLAWVQTVQPLTKGDVIAIDGKRCEGQLTRV